MTQALRVRPNPTCLAAAGLVGLAIAVFIRVRVAGPAGPSSVPAGLCFGLVLLLLAATLGERLPAIRRRDVVVGVLGAATLCVPVLWHRLATAGVPLSVRGFPIWAFGVTLVAIAEEALLRGAIYRLLDARFGAVTAIGLTAVAFALLHAPVYGWAVVPLDLAVGVWLGILRHVTASVTAPAIGHTLADLAGWWLR